MKTNFLHKTKLFQENTVYFLFFVFYIHFFVKYFNIFQMSFFQICA
jgi:hypothetical protein